MATKQCKNCTNRVPEGDAHLVHRTSGGSYRSAGSMKPTTICTGCVLSLAERETHKGQATLNRWSIFGLRRLAESIKAAAA